MGSLDELGASSPPSVRTSTAPGMQYERTYRLRRAADDLRLDFDLHRLADEHAARLERLVPGEPPVVATYLCVSGEADALVPPRIEADAFELREQRHRQRHILDREHTVDLEGVRPRGPQVRAGEGHHRVCLDVEEVR